MAVENGTKLYHLCATHDSDAGKSGVAPETLGRLLPHAPGTGNGTAATLGRPQQGMPLSVPVSPQRRAQSRYQPPGTVSEMSRWLGRGGCRVRLPSANRDPSAPRTFEKKTPASSYCSSVKTGSENYFLPWTPGFRVTEAFTARTSYLHEASQQIPKIFLCLGAKFHAGL